MIPILYKKNETNFTHNGIGYLSDAVKATVTEERNGPFELVLQYPLKGQFFSSITKGALIKAKPSVSGSPQLFRIYKITKPLNGICSFYAEHISYDINGYPVPGLTLSNVTPDVAVAAALSSTPLGNEGFSVKSDISTRNNINITVPCSVRSVLGGIEGSVLDVWGGEYEFDNRVIKIHSHRGKDSGVRIEYGKNLTDLKQDENISEMYTHVFPYVRVSEDTGERVVTLANNAVLDLGISEELGHKKCYLLDLTDEFSESETVSPSTIQRKAEAFVASHNLKVPKTSLTVSFLSLRKSPEYKDMAMLETVELCDTVTVYYGALGVDAKVKVIKTVFDSLSETYDKIELGDTKSTFADTVINQKNQIEALKVTTIPQQISKAAEVLDAAHQNFSAKMMNALGLYSDVINGIRYFFDKPTIEQSTYILTINSSGIAFASSWNNGSPKWNYGIDRDGGGILAALMVRKITADIIQAGTLSSVNGTYGIDLDNASQYSKGQAIRKTLSSDEILHVTVGAYSKAYRYIVNVTLIFEFTQTMSNGSLSFSLKSGNRTLGSIYIDPFEGLIVDNSGLRNLDYTNGVIDNFITITIGNYTASLEDYIKDEHIRDAPSDITARLDADLRDWIRTEAFELIQDFCAVESPHFTQNGQNVYALGGGNRRLLNGENVNDCLEPGIYYVSSNQRWYDTTLSAATEISNLPVSLAGRLIVENSNGGTNIRAASTYIIQTYMPYNNSAIYRRYVYAATAEEYNYGDWKQIPIGVEDYVVEQGTVTSRQYATDASWMKTDVVWTYRKWNSGIAECWTLTRLQYPSAPSSSYLSGVGNIYQVGVFVDLPFAFASNPSATCSNNWHNTEWTTCQAENSDKLRVRRFGNAASFSNGPTMQISLQVCGRWK